MSEDRYLCPVCGYPELDEPAWTDGVGSDDICPSCGTHFGYRDMAGGDAAERQRVHRRLRQEWKDKGCPWFDPGRPPPSEWDPISQLGAVEDGETAAGSTPAPPIFLLEDLDIAVYRSVEEAEAHLEPVDAAAGTNEGFDSLGRRLTIQVVDNRTRITLSEEKPSSAEEFERRLRQFLAGYAEEQEAADPACDLPCLVELAQKHVVEPPPSLRDILRRVFSRRKT